MISGALASHTIGTPSQFKIWEMYYSDRLALYKYVIFSAQKDIASMTMAMCMPYKFHIAGYNLNNKTQMDNLRGSPLGPYYN